MTQWLIGMFVRFLSSKDDLINCTGVGKRTLFNQSGFFPTPFILYTTIVDFWKGDKTYGKKESKKDYSPAIAYS
mgnify:FL=1